MRRALWIVCSLGLVALLAPAALCSHHSVSAEFDPDRPVSFTGRITRVVWMNPHIYTEVQVDEPDGTSASYRVEGSAPNSLYRRGWRQGSVRPGDLVTVEGVRARNPESRNVGQATITTAEGRVLWRDDAP